MVALCHCSEPAAAEASSSSEEDESLDAATQRLAHASRNPGGSAAPTQSKKLKPAAVMRKKQKHEGSSLLVGWVILECPWDIVPYFYSLSIAAWHDGIHDLLDMAALFASKHTVCSSHMYISSQSFPICAFNQCMLRKIHMK